MTPLRQVKLLWLSLAILFLANLFYLIKIDLQIEEIRLRLNVVERQR